MGDQGVLDAAVDLDDLIDEMSSAPYASEAVTAYFERFLGSPLEVLVGKPPGEVRCPRFDPRANHTRHDDVCEARHDPRVGKRRVDRAVEPFDDLGGRVPRCSDAGPGAHFEARNEIGHGRKVRQRPRSGRGGP